MSSFISHLPTVDHNTVFLDPHAKTSFLEFKNAKCMVVTLRTHSFTHREDETEKQSMWDLSQVCLITPRAAAAGPRIPELCLPNSFPPSPATALPPSPHSWNSLCSNNIAAATGAGFLNFHLSPGSSPWVLAARNWLPAWQEEHVSHRNLQKIMMP